MSNSFASKWSKWVTFFVDAKSNGTGARRHDENLRERALSS